MTIRKGEDWGAVGPVPSDCIVVEGDAAARAIVEAARRANEPVPPITVRSGDLFRTMGSPTEGGESRLLPVDVGAVLLDGRLHWFVSSLVAGRPLGRGRSWIVMNAAWLGELNVAPKAHPNDGLLDVLDSTLGFGDARRARRRATLGDHLPHPGITTARTKAAQIELPEPLMVVLDGVAVGRFRTISVRCEPDALTVVT